LQAKRPSTTMDSPQTAMWALQIRPKDISLPMEVVTPKWATAPANQVFRKDS
jgi:hypothetical protein